jgi:uncharacterized membrane protein YdfJ with MMPL/SSD domain
MRDFMKWYFSKHDDDDQPAYVFIPMYFLTTAAFILLIIMAVFVIVHYTVVPLVLVTLALYMWYKEDTKETLDDN